MRRQQPQPPRGEKKKRFLSQIQDFEKKLIGRTSVYKFYFLEPCGYHTES